jgi:hypothetical protein
LRGEGEEAPPEMADDLISWERPHFEPGGGSAMIFFALYGKFGPMQIQISREVYRTAGVPSGIVIKKLESAPDQDLPFTRGSFARLLEPEEPALFLGIQNASECIVIQGDVPDPADLNYLRDAIGLVMYFLDYGATAVMDPQRLRLYDAARWKREMFAPQPPNWLHHSIILASDEPGGTRWLHTRGLRKFGRPDLSMRGVTEQEQRTVVELFNRLIILQVEGARIAEGQELSIGEPPERLICRYGGSLEDPNFNNIHVEICRTTA